MGLLSSALQIGRSALTSYQSALQVTGNNVANAGNPDYTRQTATLSSMQGGPLPEGMRPGAGVALTALRRHIDEALEGRLRTSISDAESAVAGRELLLGVEILFDEFGGGGLSAKFLDFFNDLEEVANDPTDLGLRAVVISDGVALADAMRSLRSDLASLAEAFADEVVALVQQADTLAEQIASLNSEINQVEAGSPSGASALRDQRDAALRDLSEIIDVTVRIQPNGMVNVYVGSETLVTGAISRGLSAVEELDGEFRSMTVRFADSNSQVTPRGGRLEGLLLGGGSHIEDWISTLDQLAAGVIADVNGVHADGQGLIGFTSVTGASAVSDPQLVLSDPAHGWVPSVTNGSFYITVTDDATGTGTGYQIEVDLDGIDSDTTLESLRDQINNDVAGVEATITVDNRLQLVAESGLTFSFGSDGQEPREDTSGFLAAAGINTFFAGSGAGDIQVNSTLLGNNSLLAASLSGLSGDGSNAGRMASLAEANSATLGSISITEFYNGLASSVAVTTAATFASATAAESVRFSLQAQRESISGVSLDEEAIELVKLERAFQAAARFVGVVDDMIQEILALV